MSKINVAIETEDKNRLRAFGCVGEPISAWLNRCLLYAEEYRKEHPSIPPKDT
jgi:hypothetical protein